MQPPPYSPLAERTPHRPSLSRRTPLPVRVLRIVVWLSPSITIVATFFSAVVFGGSIWIVLVALGLVLVVGGGFDAILSRSTPTTDGKPDLQPVLEHCHHSTTPITSHH